MKKFALLTFLIVIIPICGYSQIGIGTTSPHASSALEISSTNTGLLIPRMTQAQRNAITAPSVGLMIYQTNNTPGFYYYTGTTWSPFVGGTAWDLAGNTATNASTNFIGTTDAVDFVMRTNNTEKARITSNGTVGFGTSTPNTSSLLDMTSSTKGILIPRMTQLQRNAITTPATGLMIYQTDNTPGFYYYTGTVWSSIAGSMGWGITGNTGTNASTNFIGTSDAVDFVMRTNNTEKARITSDGNMGVGTNNPTTRLHLVSPVGSSTFSDGFEDGTIPPFTTSGSGGNWTTLVGAGNFNSGVRGARSNGGVNNGISSIELTQTIPANGALINFAFRVNSEINFDFLRFYIDGIKQDEWSGGVNWNTVSYPVSSGSHTFRWSYEKNGSINVGSDKAWIDDVEIVANSAALRIVDGSQGNGKVLVSDANGLTSWQAPNTTVTNKWSLDGNSGTTPGTDFIGTTDNNSLVFKTNNNEYSRVLTNGRVGIGTTTPTVKLQVEDDALGLAVIRGVNTNTNTSNISYGVRGESNSTALGSAGLIGVSTNLGQNEMGVIGDYGLWGTGVFGLGWASSYADMPTSRDFGVFGTANYPTGTGVYARDMNGAVGSYAFYGTGKFAVTGSKSASVPTTKGNQLVYCTESPEIWFEDLGGGKLVNGQVHIALDPMFLETIFISDEHKMRIFLQEEGESNGLIVIKDADNKGFTVKEKNGGTSNIDFSFRIMAKRRFYQNQRFGVDSNQPFENNLAKAKDVEVITSNPDEMRRFVEEQRLLKESQFKK